MAVQEELTVIPCPWSICLVSSDIENSAHNRYVGWPTVLCACKHITSAGNVETCFHSVSRALPLHRARSSVLIGSVSGGLRWVGSLGANFSRWALG